MSVIVCNINMNSYAQTVYVADDQAGIMVPYYCSIDNLEQVLTELVTQYNKVYLYGNEDYVSRYVKYIQDDIKLNFSNDYPIDIYVNDNYV